MGGKAVLKVLQLFLITKCAMDMSVFSGSNTTFPCFADRVRKKIRALAPPTMKTVVVSPRRKYSVRMDWVAPSSFLFQTFSKCGFQNKSMMNWDFALSTASAFKQPPSKK